jgi:hypothetical protein
MLYMVVLTVGELAIVTNAYVSGASPFVSIWHIAAVLAISASRSSLRLADCRLQHSPELSRFLLVKPLFEQHGAQQQQQQPQQQRPTPALPSSTPVHELRLVFVCRHDSASSHSLSAMVAFLESLQTPVTLLTIEQMEGHMEPCPNTLYAFCIENAEQGLEYTRHFANRQTERQILVVSRGMLEPGQPDGMAAAAGENLPPPMAETLARYSPLVLGSRRFSRDFMLALSTKLITILHAGVNSSSEVSSPSRSSRISSSSGTSEGEGGAAVASGSASHATSTGNMQHATGHHAIDYSSGAGTTAVVDSFGQQHVAESLSKVFV